MEALMQRFPGRSSARIEIKVCGVVLLWSLSLFGHAAGDEVAVGQEFQLRGQTFTLTRLVTLPYVESEYTRRFRFDSWKNPKLNELREQHRLDEVISRGIEEFDRQILLNDWTHRQFRKFGQPSTAAQGALQILSAIEAGHTFFCSQYAEVFVSAAASVGWVSRPLALRRHRGAAKVGGSTEHSAAEVWSNQYGKWIMLDPTLNLYVEKAGIPLNAGEIRQAWFYHDGAGLEFVVGQNRQRYRKSDLPVLIRHFEGFGDLSLQPDELDKYGFIGYIPNNDLMDRGYDYANMFIVKDALCDGTSWHTRTVPNDPLVDPYFPVGQSALKIRLRQAGLQIEVQTLTPNFENYEVRFDGGDWQASSARFRWNPRPGVNRLEVRSRNRFGVHGPPSIAELIGQ
jgi:hypothetical protein